MEIKENTWERIIQIILLVLIACGIFVMVFLNIDKSNGKPMGPGPGGKHAGTSQTSGSSNAVAVETYESILSDVFKTIRVNGDVISETSIAIYSDTNGRLTNLKINLGDKVARNSIIAYVDPSLPGQNYSLSPVRSTISGTVTKLPLKAGDKVTSQTALATVGDLNKLQIISYIPERFIATLELGLKADLSFDAYPNETFEGLLTEISPVMDMDSRTLEIRLVLTGQDKRIRPGMFASLQLITEQRINTLAVPFQAVFLYYGEQAVYVISQENTAERRIIETGLTTDETVEVLSGLEEGDLVITQGLTKLTEGTAVRSVSGEIN